ncbi:MAG: hypothetical protein Q8S94_11345 [Pseudohongiella sp.]|nr:hypothetical protein [Pseudohongiella sp.]
MMEFLSMFSSAGAWLAALLHHSPVLQYLVDLGLKSMALLAMFFMIDTMVSTRIASTTRHVLWLFAFVCLALLPFGAFYGSAAFAIVLARRHTSNLPGGAF